MRKPKKEIQLTSYDELLGINEAEQNTLNQIVEVPLNELHPFRNHPFHVNDDEKMAETVESIKNYGILNPALVRPRAEGGYELIAGHRRKRGCELAGKSKMPVLIRNYTDDEAVIVMVDSNIQRESLLPSEKICSILGFISDLFSILMISTSFTNVLARFKVSLLMLAEKNIS